jgi:hypothetical protein
MKVSSSFYASPAAPFEEASAHQAILNTDSRTNPGHSASESEKKLPTSELWKEKKAEHGH